MSKRNGDPGEHDTAFDLCDDLDPLGDEAEAEVFHAEYDNDPSPYAGDYSED
jgi:hypothetical protein